jgi:pimeloyl-ACP methyl ester carboxylesterase
MDTDKNKAPAKFDFPVGYLDFHKEQVFNFQLNRWYSLGYARYDDLADVAARIKGFDDWKTELIKLAQKAEKDNRTLNAAYYYRAAEFYISPDDPDKMKIYEKFKRLIHPILTSDGIEIQEAPYENGYFPCLKVNAKGEACKGVIVIHGGFDSFKEEFYSIMKYFSNNGYDVIVFEGPGQGEARKKYNLVFDYKWEKPTSAVLDHFGLDDVTLLGISMGGYLCFRAAAFEPRIKKVIASSVAYDYMDFPPKIVQPIVSLFYNTLTEFTNTATIRTMKKGGLKSWYFSNLIYMTGSKRPIDAVRYLTKLTAEALHCDRVTQDVLILTGRDDHFTPFKMHKKQVKALINANTVTERVFYKDSSASNHCQIGNMPLNLKVMTEWVEKIDKAGDHHE